MFFYDLLIGAVLICITVVIHAIALDRLIAINDKYRNPVKLRFGKHWKIPILVFSVLGTFSAHIVQIWIWAAFYMSVGAFDAFADALYFSTCAFTTVGYGDIVVTGDWRLVSSFQSANGFMLFGWSTAFIFEVMSTLYKHDQSSGG